MKKMINKLKRTFFWECMLFQGVPKTEIGAETKNKLVPFLGFMMWFAIIFLTAAIILMIKLK